MRAVFRLPWFGDIPGSELRVLDSSGRLLGAHQLDLGYQGQYSCLFTTGIFAVNNATDEIYVVAMEFSADTVTFSDPYGAIIPGPPQAAFMFSVTFNDINDDLIPDDDSETSVTSQARAARLAYVDALHRLASEIAHVRTLCGLISEGDELAASKLVQAAFPDIPASILWGALLDTCHSTFL